MVFITLISQNKDFSIDYVETANDCYDARAILGKLGGVGYW